MNIHYRLRHDGTYCSRCSTGLFKTIPQLEKHAAWHSARNGNTYVDVDMTRREMMEELLK